MVTKDKYNNKFLFSTVIDSSDIIQINIEQQWW